MRERKENEMRNVRREREGWRDKRWIEGRFEEGN